MADRKTAHSRTPAPGSILHSFLRSRSPPPVPAPSANPGARSDDCSISTANNGGLPLNFLSQGFPTNSLSNPNTPTLYSIDPHLVTPYTQQWHLGLQYQLPADTVLEVSYARLSRIEALRFLQWQSGRSRLPIHRILSLLGVPQLITTGRELPVPATTILANDYANAANCNPALDTDIATFRSNTQSNYNSLQVRLEKRYSHGLQFEAAYTFAHSLDNASSASLGSVNNGDFLDQRYPNQNYGNSDFDVRQRFVFSYVYDLPFGRGKMFAKDASGVVNQILGNWQMSGVFSAATGNYYTATDIVPVSNGSCGGFVGYQCARPTIIGNPNATPCVPGTLFNTCAFGPNNVQGTFGDAPRNDIVGPGYTEWDTSLVKQFPISDTKRFEFRAEFFNILNHVNYLFSPFGGISIEPIPLEFDPSNINTVTNPHASAFGYPVAARAPRQIQFALKFYF